MLTTEDKQVLNKQEVVVCDVCGNKVVECSRPQYSGNNAVEAAIQAYKVGEADEYYVYHGEKPVVAKHNGSRFDFHESCFTTMLENAKAALLE